jgi:hypothetical protein
MLETTKVTCSNGRLRLAEKEKGLEALARALDDGDLVRAPLLLFFLHIDPAPEIAKYNPWHKPKGTDGGQFTTGPGAGFVQVGQDMRIRFESTFQPGIYGPDIDAAHKLVMTMAGMAILTVGKLNFRAGMPGYGQALHLALAAQIDALGNPNFHSNPVYLNEKLVMDGRIPLGASVPDVSYGPPGCPPLIVWELKTGRAVDTGDSETTEQRERALKNLPGQPLYEYILVREN